MFAFTSTLLASPSTATPVDYAGQSVLRIAYNTTAQAQGLAQLDEISSIDFWSDLGPELPGAIDIRVPESARAEVEARLTSINTPSVNAEAHGYLTTSVLIPDVQQALDVPGTHPASGSSRHPFQPRS